MGGGRDQNSSSIVSGSILARADIPLSPILFPFSLREEADEGVCEMLPDLSVGSSWAALSAPQLVENGGGLHSCSQLHGPSVRQRVVVQPQLQEDGCPQRRRGCGGRLRRRRRPPLPHLGENGARQRSREPRYRAVIDAAPAPARADAGVTRAGVINGLPPVGMAAEKMAALRRAEAPGTHRSSITESSSAAWSSFFLIASIAGRLAQPAATRARRLHNHKSQACFLKSVHDHRIDLLPGPRRLVWPVVQCFVQ